MKTITAQRMTRSKINSIRFEDPAGRPPIRNATIRNIVQRFQNVNEAIREPNKSLLSELFPRTLSTLHTETARPESNIQEITSKYRSASIPTQIQSTPWKRVVWGLVGTLLLVIYQISMLGTI